MGRLGSFESCLELKYCCSLLLVGSFDFSMRWIATGEEFALSSVLTIGDAADGIFINVFMTELILCCGKGNMAVFMTTTWSS